jgi:DNA replication protein DnaC
MEDTKLKNRLASAGESGIKPTSSTITRAAIEDIDYSVDRTIDKKMIQSLAACTFIQQNLNIVISGKTGCGKSYIACALGDNACRYGYTVKYFRIGMICFYIQQ